VRLSERGDSPVTALAKPFSSLHRPSQGIFACWSARLIQRRRQGRVHLIRSRSAGLKDAQRWIARYAAGNLDDLLKNENRKRPQMTRVFDASR
jgi:hypothetical protein